MKKFLLFILILNAVFTLCPDVFVKIKPKKSSKLTNFYVSKYLVTQSQYKRVMDNNSSLFKGEDLPVERVSWYECLVYCNRLSIIENLEPVYSLKDMKNPDDWGIIPTHRLLIWSQIKADTLANGYRLLYDKEWQYLYNEFFGKFDKSDDYYEKIEAYAWIETNSGNRTHPVGIKKADKFNLYDFLGNVLEWRYDHYGNINNAYFSYDSEAEKMFYSSLSYKRLYHRNFLIIRNQKGLYPVLRSPQIGFRIAKNVE